MSNEKVLSLAQVYGLLARSGGAVDHGAEGLREHHDVVVAHDDGLRAAAPDLSLFVPSSLS